MTVEQNLLGTATYVPSVRHAGSRESHGGTSIDRMPQPRSSLAGRSMLSLAAGIKRDHSRAWPAAASNRGSHLPIPRRGLDHMGMVAPLYYTAEMVRTLPEDRNRYETVHGELLVTPPPVCGTRSCWAACATP